MVGVGGGAAREEKASPNADFTPVEGKGGTVRDYLLPLHSGFGRNSCTLREKINSDKLLRRLV